MIKRKTGLVVDAYFSGTQTRVILKNAPGRARQSKKPASWRSGTVDSWWCGT